MVSRIAIASPADPADSGLPASTADRWAAVLRHLGHAVDVVGDAHDLLDNHDLVLAVGALEAKDLVISCRRRLPDTPVVVALTASDVSRALPSDEATTASVNEADALIVAHQGALDRLSAINPAWAAKAQVIHRTVDGPLPARRPPLDEFRVVVLAHLHARNDPLLSARAAAMLPPESRVAVHHGGRATDDDWLLQATQEASSNRRYIWHGELNQSASLELMASAHVAVFTSLSDVDDHLVAEALAIGVPVIATSTSGHIGLLGSDHAGLVAIGDELAMADLLTELEADPQRLTDLALASVNRQHLTDPAAEQAGLEHLVRSLAT